MDYFWGVQIEEGATTASAGPSDGVSPPDAGTPVRWLDQSYRGRGHCRGRRARSVGSMLRPSRATIARISGACIRAHRAASAPIVNSASLMRAPRRELGLTTWRAAAHV